jgi:hypothetical protein
MTKNTHTKTAVRARMAATGENYLTAYRALFEQTIYTSPWPEMNRILGGGYRTGLHQSLGCKFHQTCIGCWNRGEGERVLG